MVNLKTAPTSSSQILVLGLASKNGKLVVESGDTNVNPSSLVSSLELMGATGKAEEITLLPQPRSTGVELIVFTGLGDASNKHLYDHEVLRRAAGSAARFLSGKISADFSLPHNDMQSFAAITEGVGLGSYAFHDFRGSSKKDQKEPLKSATIISKVARASEPATKAILKRSAVIVKYVHIVRDLVNTPANHLSPAIFVTKIRSLSTGLGVKIEVLDEKALKSKGYGGIYSVGQGSANPPRLLHISYTPAKVNKRFAFVGKGITFDTGGYALKPAAGMDAMKTDMAGAASVVASLLAVAELKLPISLHAYACLAENMISDHATRPGDIITTLSGKTVEVLNPDAEGRLVLADGITRAIQDGEKGGGLHGLVDVATLTGAQIIALGVRTAGLMTNNDKFADDFLAISKEAGEQFWKMPLPEELRPTLDTAVADIANVGDKNGGMLVAGTFLKEFVPPEIPWLHLDIAGPSYTDKAAYGYNPVGATGITVRSLVCLAESASSQG